MDEHTFGDMIAELVQVRDAQDPVDFANRVLALSRLLTEARRHRTRCTCHASEVGHLWFCAMILETKPCVDCGAPTPANNGGWGVRCGDCAQS